MVQTVKKEFFLFLCCVLWRMGVERCEKKNIFFLLIGRILYIFLLMKHKQKKKDILFFCFCMLALMRRGVRKKKREEYSFVAC